MSVTLSAALNDYGKCSDKASRLGVPRQET